MGFGLDHLLLLMVMYFSAFLSVFYTAMPQYLGFPCYGDEYKVIFLMETFISRCDA